MELINEDSPRRSLVNVRIGTNVRLFNFINAYGCEIGDNSKIGSFVEIQKNARTFAPTRTFTSDRRGLSSLISSI